MCNTCSEVRCRVYGIVTGRKTEISNSCGVSCTYRNEVMGYVVYKSFGDDWATFIPYLGELVRGFFSRFK